MNEKTRSPVMTLKRAHELMDDGVSYQTFWRWAKRGELPTVRIGSKTFILREPFLAMFKHQRSAT
jgi:predicted site-specific integrase-resolvase